MSDRSEYDAQQALSKALGAPRPRFLPSRQPRGLHWAWQTVFAVALGLTSAALLIWWLPIVD